MDRPTRTLANREARKSRISELLVAKKDNWTIRTILNEEGLPTSSQHINDYKEEIIQEWRRKTDFNAEFIVADELATLDSLQRILWDKAAEGHLASVDRVIKIMEHRAKLLGLYAPEQHRLVGQVAIIKAYVGLDLERV